MTDKNRPEFYVPPPAFYVNTPPSPQRIMAKLSDASIETVTDIPSGKRDLLFPGSEIRVTGNRIKVTPDDEEGLGVFFLSVATGIPVIGSPSIVVVNERALLHIKVPEGLPHGSYILRIVTRYSGTNLLKHHRIIDYKNVVKCTDALDTAEEL